MGSSVIPVFMNSRPAGQLSENLSLNKNKTVDPTVLNCIMALDLNYMNVSMVKELSVR